MDENGKITSDGGFYFEKEPAGTRKGVSLSKKSVGKHYRAVRKRSPEQRTEDEANRALEKSGEGYNSGHSHSSSHSHGSGHGHGSGHKHSHSSGHGSGSSHNPDYYKCKKHHRHRSRKDGTHGFEERGHHTSERRSTEGGKTGRHGKNKGRKGEKALKVLCIVLAVILLIVLVPTVSLYIMKEKGKNDFKPAVIDQEAVKEVNNAVFYDEGKTLTYSGKKYVQNESVVPIALLGIDKYDIDKSESLSTESGQSDMNMVAAFDTETGKLTLISIPRDTLADVNVYDDSGEYIGIQQMQLCLSYSYGDGKKTSCENTVLSMERLLCGIEIGNYAALELNGIGAMADAVGGVEVVSLQTIADFNEGQTYLLTGERAQKYVQARDTSVFNSDAMRRERQIQYIKAFGKKAYEIAKSDIGAVSRLINTSKDYTYTSMSIDSVTYLATTVIQSGNFSMDNIIVIEGEAEMTDTGFMAIKPDPTSVFETVLSVFYEEAGNALLN